MPELAPVPAPAAPAHVASPPAAARAHTRLWGILLNLAAPVLAVLVALAVTSLILAAAGKDVAGVWGQLLGWPIARKQVALLNGAMALYLSGVACAIGFRMNLFNIGVEGQLRVANFAAAWVAGFGLLHGWFNVILAVLVAMTAGALWAGIAGWLKVTRGVNEVVSTIMLNWVGLGLLAWLMTKAQANPGGLSPATREIPKHSWVNDLPLVPGVAHNVYGLLPMVIAVGVGYWFILNRTRFGFDLRATGRSPSAAEASGAGARGMVLATTLLSGAVAGLIAMPALFGMEHTFETSKPQGLGFAGIAVALIGRNHPVGIGFAALLWAFLDVQAINLAKVGVSNELVAIVQGVIVLAVVVAYEVVRRVRARLERQAVARALGESAPGAGETASTAVLVDAAAAPARQAESEVRHDGD